MSKREPPRDAPTPSPAARRLAEEHGLDPDHLQGTGEGGRLLQRDVMAALVNLADDDEAEDASRLAVALGDDQAPSAPAPQIVVEEARLDGLLRLIDRWSAAFETRHGLRLGLDGFLVKAVVDALAEVPDANVQLHEGRPQRTQYYDVAVTIAGPDGPRAPVLRSPQRKSIAELQGELARFARQVDDGSLPAEAETGAVITLHHRGRTLLSTAPLDPPQCLAIAVHRVEDRPVVVPTPDGPVLAVRPVCQLCLTWDPRALDVTLASALLARMRAALEQPERMWLEV